ncbi:hypothetical protein L0F63_001351 [Massospora cicadina]|nr:hypothetical protein L0F63_001351 [Massospora cicadina]
MNPTVYKTLALVLSPDQDVRKGAEGQLKLWEATEADFPKHLADILASDECEPSVRQSAGVSLKRYIDRHWSASADKFEPPLVPVEAKGWVRVKAFRTLSCPVNRVRSAAAYVVARLAHFDWPEDWPKFVEQLIQLIRGGDRYGVHGSFRAFAGKRSFAPQPLESASDDLSDQQFTTVAPLVFPELYKVAVSQDFSHQTRIHAIGIFHSFIKMIQIVKESTPEIVAELLAPVVPAWLEFFSQLLGAPLNDSVGLGLKAEAMSAMHKLAEGFPKLLQGYEAHFATIVAGNLQRVAELYSKVEVEGEDFPGGWQAGGDSFGEGEGEDEIQLESFIYPAFGLIQCFAQKSKPPSRQALIQEPHGLSPILWAAVVLHQITKDQQSLSCGAYGRLKNYEACPVQDGAEEAWSEDPNQFAVEDDEYTLDYSVRVAAQDLVTVLMDCYGELAIRGLSSAVFGFIEALPSRIRGGELHWWKSMEACLSLVGTSSVEIIADRQKALASGTAPQFDLERLFSVDLMDLASRQECPLLTGRFFILTSQFSNALPKELCGRFLESSITTISHSPSALVRICALKSLNNFCRFLPRELLLPMGAAIFAATSELAPQLTEDGLHILLETWGAAIKIDAYVTAQQSELFLPRLLDIWAANVTDHLTSEIVRDLIHDLAGNGLLYERLLALVVPGLVRYVESPESLVVSSAIDMLTSLAEGGASLPAGYVATTFPAVLSAAAREDPELHISIQSYLKAVVQKDLDQVVAWRQGDHNGLGHIVKYVGGCLMSRSESACLSVGPLVLALLLQSTEGMLGYLPQILGPLTLRLANGSTDTFKQSLLVVLAQLCRTHLDTVLDFLSNPIGDLPNPLAAVLTAWLECHESFSGYFYIKLSAFALASVFVKEDPRVQNVQVRGRMVDINPGKIVTRSQTRAAGEHYVMLPAPARILSLLLADCRNDTYSTELHPEETDDDSWADADEFDNQGGVLLSDLADGRANERVSASDEAYKDDPLYALDLKAHLKHLFASCLASNSASLQRYVSLLDPIDRSSLAPGNLQAL